MVGCVDAYMWAKENVVSDFNPASVQHDAVKIGIEVIADGNIISKFAAESRFEIDTFSNGF